MDDVIAQIKHCPTLEDLNFFVHLPIWRANRHYWYAIFDRNAELRRVGQTRDDFPPPEFFDAMPNEMRDALSLPLLEQRDPDEDFDDGDMAVPTDALPHLGGAVEQYPPLHFYTLVQPAIQYVPHLNQTTHQSIIQFDNLEDANDLAQTLAAVFDAVLFEMLDEDPNDEPSPNSRICVIIDHPNLNTPIEIPYSRRADVNGERILREIEKVQQSRLEFEFDGRVGILVQHVELPAGYGRQPEYRGKWQPWYDRHCGNGGCFVRIKNEDTLCCARAIVTAKARLHKGDDDEGRRRYAAIRKGDASRCTAQREAARELMQAAGLADFKGACGLDELEKLQAALGPDYQIKVWCKERFETLYYQGPPAEHRIYLYLHHKHYDVITAIAAFFNTSYWCDDCNKKYDHFDQHKCARKCYCCLRIGPDYPCEKDEWKPCADCNRVFPNQECFDSHKKIATTTVGGGGAKKRRVESSLCTRYYKCKECHKMVCVRKLNGEKHVCGQKRCPKCKCLHEDPNHQCFMQPIEKETKEKPAKFIFYDFEARQDTEVGENKCGLVFLHTPNLCVVQKACELCKDSFDANKECATCGRLQRVFSGDDCRDQFCDWLFSEENKGCTAIAHNAKGYDAQFILQYLHEQAIKPSVIMVGRKLMKIDACGLRLIDSLNYFPMPLDALPKTFSLKELKKGYFPHLFNRAENANYVGDWPPIEDYMPDEMMIDKYEQFKKWFDEQQGKQFDLQKELLEYCISDVSILREACLAFRKLFKSVTMDIDPFLRGTTIASACSYVFRRNYLKPNTLAVVPMDGYLGEDKHSAMALTWLKTLAIKEGLDIQHAGNGGEVIIQCKMPPL